MPDAAWLVSTILLPLVLTEVTELGPWLARRVVQAGARLIVPRMRAARLEEEWLAGLDEWPGKLTKLIRALALVLIAVPAINWAWLDHWWERHVGGPVGVTLMSRNLKICLGANVIVRRSANAENRVDLVEFNRVLEAIFRQVRSPNPEERAEALAMIEILIQNPPPWVIPRALISSTMRRDYRTLAEAVEMIYGS